ncbi:MFS transporter [Thermocladium modestius]|uniref:MFS transporter n=1 Tax=Thermocladium modestius TaxID=62609 RepID=A0A830GRN0_9CREN|nr:MFS transporter [Thermocladium modestius]GGP19119.1 MFS transporter [Thermocladium modestius]
MNKGDTQILSASMIGTILEWYGVFLFSSGAIYIGRNFLPKTSPYYAIAETLLIFAIGFLFRPVGAVVFGHYGDRIGRKNMLIISLVLSGLSTGLVGVLPTYAQIGAAALILLVVLRLILGFALGGEWGGAMLLTLENFQSRRGFWSAFIQSTVGIGLILGAAAFYVLDAVLPQSQMFAYGWRIPYLLAFIILAIGIYIRERIPETPLFEAAQRERKIVRVPAKELFSKHWLPLLLGTLITGSSGTFFYVGAALIPSLFELLKVVTPSFAQIGVILFAVADIIFVFIGGMASERYGRRAMVIVANLIFLVIVYPSFYVKTAAAFLAFMFLYGVAHGTGYAPLGSMISEIFPTNVRYSGNSMAYQFGNAFVAGPASFVSLYLGAIAYPLYPVYAVVFSLIAIASAVKFRETKDISLMESS